MITNEIRKKLLFRKRRIYQKLLTLFGIGSSLFIFQACYGVPQDLNPDEIISFGGDIKSEDTRESIPGIEIEASKANNEESFRTQTDQNGEFLFDIVSQSTDTLINISIKDIDDELNGHFHSKDTIINSRNNPGNFTFLLKRKN